MNQDFHPGNKSCKNARKAIRRNERSYRTANLYAGGGTTRNGRAERVRREEFFAERNEAKLVT